MSPLWPDEALAEAGWANAAKRGLVSEGAAPAPKESPRPVGRDVPRRPIRQPISSFAL